VQKEIEKINYGELVQLEKFDEVKWDKILFMVKWVKLFRRVK
jgi:hypothetical protein